MAKEKKGSGIQQSNWTNQILRRGVGGCYPDIQDDDLRGLLCFLNHHIPSQPQCIVLAG